MAKSKTPRPPPTPKQPKPWDPPPRWIAGDDKDELTFLAIGRALTAWETFEISMSQLFAALLGGPVSNLPAMRAYGSIMTSKGRMEMVEAAGDAIFFAYPEPILEKDFGDLLKEAGGFSGRRNEIAHGIVRDLLEPDGPPLFFGRPQKRWGFAVVPSDYATNKTVLTPPEGLFGVIGSAPKYAYTSVQISSFTAAFVALRLKTDEMRKRVLIHVARSSQTPSP